MPYDSDIIVVGCGNILFKDDGFGPILINLLQKYSNDTNDYYDPVVTSYVEEDFNKNILNQIQEKFEGITLPDSIQFVDGGTAAPSNFFPRNNSAVFLSGIPRNPIYAAPSGPTRKDKILYATSSIYTVLNAFTSWGKSVNVLIFNSPRIPCGFNTSAITSLSI